MKEHNQEECLSVGGGGVEVENKCCKLTTVFQYDGWLMMLNLWWILSICLMTHFLKKRHNYLITGVHQATLKAKYSQSWIQHWCLSSASFLILPTVYLHVDEAYPAHFTHPLQLEAECLIPAQSTAGCPARLADHSGVQPEHGAEFSCRM